MPGRRLGRRALGRDVHDVAPALLGATLTHAGVTVRLTEVEAYSGAVDPGSHAYRGRTPRTAPMFGAGGLLYVYFTYGMHWCVNVVTGREGTAQAVLLRAGEVVAGHDTAAVRRPGVRPRDWCRGPARLATTLGVDGALSGLDTTAPGSPVVLRAPAEPVDPARWRSGPRVGVAGEGGDADRYPWRWWLDGEPTVSPYRPAKPRAPRPGA
ncbi:DNA-3-methyladenine glycosylase [Lapillicoccus jejuensis]|uniref:Putative 3-methyladenine DNA glycosylase n=1 Tax=Lapillicoccus jejuensis TaxID=402171 RepID=A0A542E6M3_9MICO|nr:DNA-3-methyladenine glycosylase [Lapillicoccus jejuensis]TQJ10981.1 DNA-3-methyladenine glycosylase [Lapillicoccus jejuensis]